MNIIVTIPATATYPHLISTAINVTKTIGISRQIMAEAKSKTGTHLSEAFHLFFRPLPKKNYTIRILHWKK